MNIKHDSFSLKRNFKYSMAFPQTFVLNLFVQYPSLHSKEKLVKLQP